MDLTAVVNTWFLSQTTIQEKKLFKWMLLNSWNTQIKHITIKSTLKKNLETCYIIKQVTELLVTML